MLAVSDFVAGYGSRPLVRLDALAIAAGEAALLTGPSGAGKTTLLLALAGLADRLSGQARLDGVDLAALSPRARDRHRGRHVSVIFQDLHLVTGLSAVENMLLGPYASGQAQDRARSLALLDRLGVAALADRRAESLSRGEAQRVAIARAMLGRPQLILADEPTASLDDDSAETVLRLLLDAARDSGAALLVATHDGRIRSRIPAHVAVEPMA